MEQNPVTTPNTVTTSGVIVQSCAQGDDGSLVSGASVLANISDQTKQTTKTTTTVTSAPSPTLSPPGKVFGRNNNGTMVVTSTPSNEAELQLYRVLQRASLLAYYDTLLEMGGDDVQQLCDAGEEEFLEIMALVGMASKPLHVRRLQKALHEWMTNPSAFQNPLPNIEVPRVAYSPEPGSISRSVGYYSQSPSYITHPSSSTNTSTTSALSSIGTSLGTQIEPKSGMQLTPTLTESQIARIAMASEAKSRTIQLEPFEQTSKKRPSRELGQVIAMSEQDPRRMDEIRKYSAIYGRFDCKRNPGKPLTLHEVCVNEAAAQICKFIPALLMRRDKLFPLAREVVREAGFGHSASIRLAGLSQTQSSRIDEMDTSQQMKRARLSSDTSSDLGKENSDDNRDLQSALYQQMNEKPFDLTESSKFSFSRSEFDDTDSRFSFSNSSSSPLQGGNGIDRDMSDPDFTENLRNELRKSVKCLDPTGNSLGVQVISASGGHIIAVANPALALSPALSETISIKREAISPDL